MIFSNHCLIPPWQDTVPPLAGAVASFPPRSQIQCRQSQGPCLVHLVSLPHGTWQLFNKCGQAWGWVRLNESLDKAVQSPSMSAVEGSILGQTKCRESPGGKRFRCPPWDNKFSLCCCKRKQSVFLQLFPWRTESLFSISFLLHPHCFADLQIPPRAPTAGPSCLESQAPLVPHLHGNQLTAVVSIAPPRREGVEKALRFYPALTKQLLHFTVTKKCGWQPRF